MDPLLFAIIIGLAFIVVGFVLFRFKPRVDKLQDRITKSMRPNRFTRVYHILSKTAYTIFIVALPLFGLLLIFDSISRR